MKPSRKTEIRIDRLVVEGVDTHPHQAHRIRAAMEQELARLFGNEESLDRIPHSAVPALRAPELRAPKGNAPGDLGRAIARSIHSLISGKP